MEAEFIFEKQLAAQGVFKTRKKEQYRNIIKYLYYNGSSSIASVVKAQDVSKPLVASLIDDLVKFGLVEDNGMGDSIGGRRPNIFSLNSNYQFVVGVEINLHNFSIIIYNLSNEIVVKKTYDIDLKDTNEYLDSLLDCLFILLSIHKIDKSQVLSMGISIPGLVDSKQGLTYTRLAFVEEGIVNYLEHRLKFSVIIENDARTMAMGEKEFGKAKGKKNVLCLNLSNGIGLGMIVNGVLNTGKNGFAGEFGHILVDTDGILCYCGKIGCLETVFSGKLLVKQIKESIDNGQLSLMSVNSENKIKIADVVDAILAGDQFSIETLSQMLEYLGRGLVTLIHLLNPEMIIIGGKLAPLGKFIIDPIKISVNKYSMTRISEETEILVSDLLADSVPMGIMANVMCKILN